VVVTKTVVRQRVVQLPHRVLQPVRQPIVQLLRPSPPVVLTTWTTTFRFKVEVTIEFSQ
jgi:hypothetical protein